MRRGGGHRALRWLWTSRRVDARLARMALLPAAGLWEAAMHARVAAFRYHWLATRELPLPSVAVGNLSVGGSGKTPIASWIAQHYVRRGLTPGILLRPYKSEDEAGVHTHDVPSAIVIADEDRVRGAALAMTRGAEVLVLDDAYQRLDIWRDWNILLIAAETSRAVRWPLPAGPWRERWSAIKRADAVIITRKRADPDIAAALAADCAARIDGPVAVVHLHLFQLRGLVTNTPMDAVALHGKKVVAATAIADPEAFLTQVKATGAQVQVATWANHHAFRDEDVAWLAKAARKADYVVLTQKDAVKLRNRWPASIPEPLVAVLDPAWESGEAEITQGLDAVVASL